MNKLPFFLTLTLLLLACKANDSKKGEAFLFIPKNADVIFKTTELNNLILSETSHPIFSSFKNHSVNNTFLKSIKSEEESYLAFYNSGSENSHFIFTTKFSESLIEKIVDAKSKAINEDLNLTEIVLDGESYYYKIIDGVFISSNNLDAIQHINNVLNNPQAYKLITATGSNAHTVLFRPKYSDFKKLLFDIPIEDSEVLLDLDFSEQNLKFNGLVVGNDSISNFSRIFQNTLPQKNTITDMAPKDAASVLSISYDNFSNLKVNLNSHNNKDSDTLTFLNFTNEIGLIKFNNNKVIAVHTLDVDLLTNYLNTENSIESFKSVDIYKFGDIDFFKTKLKPILSFDNTSYYAFYKNHVLFSDTIDSLKAIITNILNNQTLSNYEAYKALANDLSTDANIFYYKNEGELAKLLSTHTKGYSANAIQLTSEDGYTFVNGSILKYRNPKKANTITEDFSLKLDTAILVSPQLVKNHITKTYDIVVQDINNVLYLISNTGEILWEKQLQGRILGEIEQIDSYKNGKLQLVFATSNKLYLMDRNGNDLKNFPMTFTEKITKPLSVFDYDNTKNYRFLITQNKSLSMYNSEGKIVTGFNYKSNNTTINCQPKHFRINKKDYIVFITGKTLQILNRRGKTRIRVNDEFAFSDNTVFLYNNKFTTTNTAGQMIQVDTNGKLNIRDLNLPENHTINSTSKTFVSMYENILNIKSKTLDLDFGNYTKPEIFYLNNKIYVSTTDLQAKKIQLFNSQAKPINNFPIFGSSKIALENIDKEPGLEIITQSDSKTILAYSIN